jgi:hypothetical protein
MQKYRSTMPMLLGLCLAGSTLAATPGSAALGPTGTVFDGDYAGAMNQTTPGVAGDGPNSDSACAPTRPATMLIRNGNVTLQYADWAGNVLHYRGIVSAGGQVDLYHTNDDGNRSILAGLISNDVLKAHVERAEACNYSMSLAKK